jgi:glucokinase
MRVRDDVWIGIDLGRTKLRIGAIDGDGRVLAARRLATPSGGPEIVVETIARGVGDVLAGAGVAPGGVPAVGVGAPGPLDPDAGVVLNPPNMPGWVSVPLAARLRDRLGRPAFVDNDANAAALGEHWVGAGAGVDDLVYVTLSSGIGGGLIVGGRLYRGASGQAGELGHMVVDPRGPQCACGRRGCLEAIASGFAIARAAQAALASGRPTTLGASPAGTLSAADVARAAYDGDPVAREIYARAGAAVGACLADLVNLLNPAMIIVGGGVARAGDLLWAPMRRVVDAEAFPHARAAVRLVPAALGDDAGVVGAAAVARERHAPR